MSLSSLLTNSLFCGLAALLLLPSLKHPNILTYKKGIPIFIAITLIFTKLLIPYEFSFTQTLASRRVLPVARAIATFPLITNFTTGRFLLYIWMIIAILLLICVISRYYKIAQVLSVVPETKNQEIAQMLSNLCISKQIKYKPKIIQLDLGSAPFITGLQTPTIVLPYVKLTKDELKFILLHELEHLKHGHLLIKISIEIITAIYWWNPIVWLLRWEIIQALEMQADTYVIYELSNQESLSYLEVLLQFCRKKHLQYKSSIALSFSLKNSMVENRIKMVLKYNCFHNKTKTSISYICLSLLSALLLFASFVYTFESYNIDPVDAEGTFTVNSKIDYFIFRGDGSYNLYIDGEYVATMFDIPNDLSNLLVYN